MTSTLLLPPLPRAGTVAAPAPQVEVVVRAVAGDEAAARAAARLEAALSLHFPSGWRASAAGRPGGPTVLEAWLAGQAPVRCTIEPGSDPRALLPLVAPLLSGHSDVAIGARPGRLARLGRRIAPVADDGLLAVRAGALAALAPRLASGDDDLLATELVVLARRDGMRVFELAAEPGPPTRSRPDAALRRARGLARLAVRSHVGRFLGVGALCTLAYAVLFLALRGSLGASGANAAALAITAAANTQANRRLTFRIRGFKRLLRDHAQGAAVFVLTLGLTQAALALLDFAAPAAPRAVELTVLVAASAVATLTRFLALRRWVFAPGLRDSDGSKPAPRISPARRPMLSS